MESIGRDLRNLLHGYGSVKTAISELKHNGLHIERLDALYAKLEMMTEEVKEAIDIWESK